MSSRNTYTQTWLDLSRPPSPTRRLTVAYARDTRCMGALILRYKRVFKSLLLLLLLFRTIFLIIFQVEIQIKYV